MNNQYLESEIETETKTAIHPLPRAKPFARRAARVAVVASAASAFAIVLSGILDPGYNPLSEAISALASRESQSAPLMTLGFCAMAATLVAAGLALFSQLPSRFARAAAVLIVVAGACTAADGYFRQDCSSLQLACQVRESAGTVSGSHVLHNLIALPLFVLLVVAGFMLAAALRALPDYDPYAAVTLVAAGAALVLLKVFGAGLYGDLGGLVQRALVLVAFGWPVCLAWRVTRAGS